LLCQISELEIESCDVCPFVILRLKENLRPAEILDEAKLYQAIVDKVRDRGIAITRTKYTMFEKYPPPPQIRVSVMVLHTEEQIHKVHEAVRDSVQEILQ